MLITQVNSLLVCGFTNFYTEMPPGSESYEATSSNLNSSVCTCCHPLFKLRLTAQTHVLCADSLKESEQIVVDGIYVKSKSRQHLFYCI